jgi:[glutamine synthetase] adenylyltransferase / [glutamine synthetase]-adenylyl-L-tyrosine phosphorylase
MTMITANLPELLQSQVADYWQDYQSKASPDMVQFILDTPPLRDSIGKVWACSPFVAKYALQQTQAFAELLRSGELLQVAEDCQARLTQYLASFEPLNEPLLMSALRRFRRREMVRIAWRDVAGWADLPETLLALSRLADASIESALTAHYEILCQQFGEPIGQHTGTKQHLIVLGMGKLGGQELNFSSDIDLIFAYPEAGETQSPRRSRTNQEFFVRLGQLLINTLNQITADGFVFRVDMRLRPFGDSGPLVMHFDAMEEYYQSHARDWERYALIKARVVAGDKAQGESLLKSLRPFIYRRYLDYGAFESLRNMKALIDQETRRKGLENNLKLGPGGIREVEFSCQVFQLIRGGRQPDLQSRHLLITLDRLEQHALLTPEETKDLKQAYYFLRFAENHLQAIDDRQTQTLPDDALNQLRLAFGMGCANWTEFMTQLAVHQHQVQQVFARVIAPVENITPDTEKELSREWQTFWLHTRQDDTQAVVKLKAAGFNQTEELLTHLQRFAQSSVVQRLSARARERLDKIVPLTLQLLAAEKHTDSQDYDAAFHRLLDLIEAIALRSVYMALLIERPKVLQQVVKLCLKSAWIAEQMTRYPLLLDELLEHRDLYNILNPAELDNALQAQLAHLPHDDVEMQMDSMRQFKRAHVLKVAASELSGNLTVEVASDYLAAIADTLTRRALSLAWDHVASKHGQPSYTEQGQRQVAGFCIVAYGKAGGIELSYGSDLDVVFLHDSHGEQQHTDGEKSVDNNVFFARLAQRIIHILTTNTAAGHLYEVDPRLRPGGSSGLLVSAFDAFLDYQRNDAWLWEHQALVRARAIAGDLACQQRFEAIRHEILCLSRDPEKVRAEVREMRLKMRNHLDKSTSEIFDIKQGTGGITDIEFIVQGMLLTWAAQYPHFTRTTGMLPLLRLFHEHHILTSSCCDELSEAYRLYRAETHKLALQNKSALAPVTEWHRVRENVQHWWKTLIE